MAEHSSPSPFQRRYPAELRERAVRMVFETTTERGERHGAVTRVAGQLRIPVKAISQSGVFDHPRSEAAKRPTRRVASPLDAHLLPGVLRVVSHGGFGRWGGAVDLGVLPPKGVAA